ncbi:MAG: VWA domain-containing protein [Oscillospiraceae bacterium]|nr:VWA domain-containing protein [Oscillospiraceae bacterium]
MGSNYGSKYHVDIVMCIDATGSMGPLIDVVKQNALSFYGDLISRLNEKNKHVDEVRVRIIVFRDYLADGENAMLASNFFTLPAQADEFRALVNSIEPMGGGDDPEDGLEALGYAIKSKWTQEGVKRRHIIVLWTDDATHDLGFGAASRYYPTKMAKDFSELSLWWGCGQQQGAVMDPKSKRLLIYAPAKESWTTIAETWDNTLMFPSEAGRGLDRVTYDEILDAICGSV